LLEFIEMHLLLSKNLHLTLYILILSVCTTFLYGQGVTNKANTNIVVRGIVVDSVSNEALRGATVRIEGSTMGVATNSKGIFQFKLSSIIQRLKSVDTNSITNRKITFAVSMIGYKTERITIGLDSYPTVDTMMVLFKLKEAVSLSGEVLVYADDPAVRLMRRVIEKKKRLTDSLKSYSYTLYTKFDASSDTVTAGRTSGRGDTTIISIFESYSKGYFSAPDKYFNEITQRRQTANIPPEANIVAFGTNLNAYDDAVTFFNEQISTPFHPEALDYYDFTIIKKIEEDDSLVVVKVKVVPKSNQRRLFEGEIEIDERNFVPVSVQLQPNKAVQLPFNAQVYYTQTFQQNGGFTLPSYMRIQANVQISLFWVINPRLDLNIETMAYDYNTNIPIQDELFEQRRIEVQRSAEKFDSTFWNEKSVMELRPEEKIAYQQIEESLENQDSSVTSGLFDQIFGWIPRTLAKLNRRPFTGFDDMFRYNRVHGLYLGVGLLDTLFRFDIEAFGKVGYGFSDKRFYGDLGLRYFYDSTRKFWTEATVYNRLTRRDNPYIVQPTTITLLTLLGRNDYADYYYNRGLEISTTASFGQLRFIRRDLFARPTNLRFFFRREEHTTADVNATFSIGGRDRPFRDNPQIQNGILQSVGAELGWQFSPYRRISNFGIGVNVEHASKATGSRDFDFTLLSGSLVARTRTLPLWRLDFRASCGVILGNAPPQRFFSLESSVGGLAAESVFRGMNVKEFYGDKFAAVSIEHSFGELIPGVLRIPNIASFGIEFIAIGRLGWTSFSDQTRLKTMTELPSTSATADTYYYEAGLALNRILIFLRLDISARLSQRNNPQFMFTISSATF
jgi:hypothetical protein